SYEETRAEFDRLANQFQPLLSAIGQSNWCEQIMALRRFWLACRYDRPINEREREFSILQRTGFPHPSAHIDTLISRFRYLAALGDVVGQKQSLAELKQIGSSEPRFCPSNFSELVADLERQLPTQS